MTDYVMQRVDVAPPQLPPVPAASPPRSTGRASTGETVVARFPNASLAAPDAPTAPQSPPPAEKSPDAARLERTVIDVGGGFRVHKPEVSTGSTTQPLSAQPPKRVELPPDDDDEPNASSGNGFWLVVGGIVVAVIIFALVHHK